MSYLLDYNLAHMPVSTLWNEAVRRLREDDLPWVRINLSRPGMRGVERLELSLNQADQLQVRHLIGFARPIRISARVAIDMLHDGNHTDTVFILDDL